MLSLMEFSVQTPDDFSAVIEYLLALPAPSSGARCITLTGDLGAGKTTFTQQLAQHLGITEHVVSPTFVVMKSYEIPEGPGGQNLKNSNRCFARLVHIDAYRFEDESEAGPLRLAEYFADPQNLICLEWPERVAGILPEERIAVQIEIEEGEIRKVTVSH